MENKKVMVVGADHSDVVTKSIELNKEKDSILTAARPLLFHAPYQTSINTKEPNRKKCGKHHVYILVKNVNKEQMSSGYYMCNCGKRL